MMTERSAECNDVATSALSQGEQSFDLPRRNAIAPEMGEQCKVIRPEHDAGGTLSHPAKGEQRDVKLNRPLAG